MDREDIGHCTHPEEVGAVHPGQGSCPVELLLDQHMRPNRGVCGQR